MLAGDAVRRLSDELARDPASLAFLPLAELLVGRGELDVAWTVARRGQARHADRADAHDLVARLAARCEAWDEALAAWTRAAELAPAGSPLRAAALQGQAYVCFRLGRLGVAEAYLDAAAAAGAPVEAVAAARARIRAARGDGDARDLFDPLLGADDRLALLVDRNGSVVAGRTVGDGVAGGEAAIAPVLAGMNEAAERAMRYLALGRWERITIEADGATLALVPADAVAGDAVVAVAASPATPLGRLRRLLEQVGERARAWRRESA